MDNWKSTEENLKSYWDGYTTCYYIADMQSGMPMPCDAALIFNNQRNTSCSECDWLACPGRAKNNML